MIGAQGSMTWAVTGPLTGWFCPRSKLCTVSKVRSDQEMLLTIHSRLLRIARRFAGWPDFWTRACYCTELGIGFLVCSVDILVRALLFP